MRYGFYLPTRGPLGNPDDISEIARAGERLGYATIVFGDHIVFPVKVESPYPYTVDGGFPGVGDAMEQLTLMSFVAGITTSQRLVTSVMILPHRNPLATAKILATIDVLSKGRVTVGVGVGWMREEFEALDAPAFDQRGVEHLAEGKAVVQAVHVRRLQRGILPVVGEGDDFVGRNWQCLHLRADQHVGSGRSSHRAKDEKLAVFP